MLSRHRSRDTDSECCISGVCDPDPGSELQVHQPLDVRPLQGRPGHVLPLGPDLAQCSGEVCDGEAGWEDQTQKSIMIVKSFFIKIL